MNRSAVRTFDASWAAAGPAAMAVLLLIRAAVIGDDASSIVVGVAVLLLVAAVVVARRVPISPLLLVLGPVALVASPARVELAFNLARPDQTGWFLLTLGLCVAAGWSLAGAVSPSLTVRRGEVGGVGQGGEHGGEHGDASTAGRRRRPAVTAVVSMATVLLGTAVTAGSIWATGPEPDLGRSLSASERVDLPVVGMVNFAFAPMAVEIVDGRLRARLDNPSDLPHSFAIDALGLDVYVPARRWADLDIAIPPESLAAVDTLRVYCSVGDHEPLGMVSEILVG